MMKNTEQNNTVCRKWMIKKTEQKLNYISKVLKTGIILIYFKMSDTH